MLQFCNLHWRGEKEDHSARLTDSNKMRLYLKKHILKKRGSGCVDEGAEQLQRK
jgi:hypothetical protein